MKEILKYAATVLLTIVLSMTGFWLMIGRDFITRAEAAVIADDKVALISQRLNDKIESDKEIVRALENNTKAINEFKINIATLSKTLEFMDDKLKNKYDE